MSMNEVSPYGQHQSVLLNECIQYLTEKIPLNQDSLFADLTFGRGGHSYKILETLPRASLIGFDQDPDAIKFAQEQIEAKKLNDRLTLIHKNFVHFSETCKDKKFDGILLDLGVSSHQFDSQSRGFSFKYEADLDMRMNYQDSSILPAKELLNSLSEDELEEIIREYGEERYSKRIARKIVTERVNKPFSTTTDLENLVFHIYPPKERHSKLHPATRTFQAFRIAVNRELTVIKEIIPTLVPMLNSGGRILIISFHSLEDRIVKWEFRRLKDEFPDQVQILTKRPILPTSEEISHNSRSRSAKLRILEHL